MKMSADELAKYHTIAKSKNTSLAKMIRDFLQGEKPKISHKQKSVDSNLLRELNAIGNNVNQIARRLNESDEHLQTLIALSSIEEQLQRVLNAHQIP